MLKTIFLAIIVSASIDSASIMLGDQTDLHLKATCSADEQVFLPVYGEQLIEDVEVVNRTSVDTVTLADGRVEYNQTLTLTSFHDSLFYIGAQPFVSGNDTLWSDPTLSLDVIQPFEIDTADQAITDIKPVMHAQIWWWGIIRWILLGLGLCGLGIGLYFLIRKIKQLQSGQIQEQAKEPERPAEEIAYEQLDKIRDERVWQSGQTKLYHTQLTAVVREYIGRRFDIHSTEKTSDDTLREMQPVLCSQRDLFQELKKMLQLADLVKFAKWTTTPEENEQALTTAYRFVKETTGAPAEDNAKPEGKEVQQ